MIAFEILAEFIEEPQKAAHLAAERRRWPIGILALAASGGSLFLAQAVSRHFLPVASGPASFVLVCLGTVAGGFGLAASVHLIADALGHRGSGAGLFTLFGLSALSWALMLPVCLILRAARLDSIFAVAACLLAAGLWSLRLKARSIRHIYGVSGSGAWGILMVPYVSVVLLGAAIFTAAIVSVTLSVFKAFS